MDNYLMQCPMGARVSPPSFRQPLRSRASSLGFWAMMAANPDPVCSGEAIAETQKVRSVRSAPSVHSSSCTRVRVQL